MAANDDDEAWGNWQADQARLETVAVRAELRGLRMCRLLGCILWMSITDDYV